MTKEPKLLVTKFSLELTTRFLRKSRLAVKDSALRLSQVQAVSYL
jgi:hypothetical protein